MEIHGPSVGIGAAVTAAVIVAAFFAIYSSYEPEAELKFAPIPSVEGPGPLSVYLSGGSPVLGDPGAPVTIVEFGDYQCFFCNRFFHDTEAALVENYVDTGKANIIFKDYTIIGSDSISAAHGAHCADEQGKFWEYHDILYDNWTGENNGWASHENLEGFAAGLGLDVEQWNGCMADGGHQNKIAASGEDARTLGLGGTPAFFVIGPDDQVTQITGAQPYARFAEILDAELAK